MNAIASNGREFHTDCDRRAARPRRVRPDRRAVWYEWLAVALVVLLLAYAAFAWARPVARVTPDHTARVHVGSGDTLWSLARTHPTPGLTTAQNVELISTINGLTGGALSAGEVLLVPNDTSQTFVAAR